MTHQQSFGKFALYSYLLHSSTGGQAAAVYLVLVLDGSLLSIKFERSCDLHELTSTKDWYHEHLESLDGLSSAWSEEVRICRG